MSDDIAVSWLKSRQFAQVNGLRIRPLEHRALPDTPVVVQRGQAEASFHVDEGGSQWIIKRFLQGRAPDLAYLHAVGHLLPRHSAFTAGTDRQILSAIELHNQSGCYFSLELQQWLDGAILMPRIPGIDWAALADDLRDGSVVLTSDQRLALCRQLAELVKLLESAGCVHRDLSSGNVFVDTASWKVMLIDFDSIYHATLAMPATTTCGTEGYTAAFVWQGDRPVPHPTWCIGGDRFQLALLIAEFLALEQGAPLGAEGGMFDQQDLRDRQGSSLQYARRRLHQEYPNALGLFDAAISSTDCTHCPTPDDWLGICAALQGPAPIPLASIEVVSGEDLIQILRKRIPAAPIWPVPKLNDLTVEPFGAGPVVTLPDDPWEWPNPTLDDVQDPWT